MLARMTLARLLATACCVIACVALSGCGGGGGGGGGGATCTPGGSCTLASPRTCHTGVVACQGTTAVCQDVNVAEGTTCGTGQACFAGSCLAAGTLTVYWNFARHTLGSATLTAYDADPLHPLPSTLATGACAESGADTVSIAITDATTGQPVSLAASSFPCVLLNAANQSVQGLSFGLQPGTYDVTLSGLLGSVVEYIGTSLGSVSVAAGSDNSVTVTAVGVQNSMDVGIALSGLPPLSCGTVTQFQFELVDGANTVVASDLAHTALCTEPTAQNPSLRPGIFFHSSAGEGIDLDVYTLRIRALDAGNNPVFDTNTAGACAFSNRPARQHSGDDTFASNRAIQVTLSPVAPPVCPYP